MSRKRRKRKSRRKRNSKTNKRKYKTSKKRRASNRGYAFERRFAKRVDGHKYPGPDGDVAIGDPNNPDWIVECKYRTGMQLLSRTELRDFFEQIDGYRLDKWDDGQRYALAFTGGRAYRGPAKSGIYVAIPVEEFVRFLELEDLEELRRKAKELGI